MPISSVLPLNLQQTRVFARKAKQYNHALTQGTPGAEYLLAERGMDVKTARMFGLGIVDDDEYGAHAKGRICIPSLNASNEVVALKFRAVDNADPKYLAPSGTGQPLFNTRAITKVRDFIVLTEGEFDALAVEKAGYPAVGIPGVANWKPFYRRMFEAIPAIYFIFDDDAAGHGLLSILRTDLNVIPVRCPDGMKDPSEMLKRDPSGASIRDMLARAA